MTIELFSRKLPDDQVAISQKMLKRLATRTSFIQLRSIYSLAPLVVAFGFLPAHGLCEDVIRPYLAYSYHYDDNVLRFKNREMARAIIGTGQLADTSRQAEGGLLFKKKVGQQHLVANLKVSRTDFSRFSQLDYEGTDLLAQWNWRLGRQLDGSVGVSHVKSLTPFVDFHLLQANLRSQQRQFVKAAWLPHPRWRLHSGFTRYKLVYDLESQRTGNRNEDTAEFGLDHLSYSGSSIGVQVRHVRGGYPHKEQMGSALLDNSYDQDDLMAKLDWRATGKSRLQFLGGRVQRKHEAFPARDFNGFNARVTATWAPTAKTAVVLSSWRETGSYDDLTAGYTVNRGLSLAPIWNMTAKVRIDGLFRYQTRDFDPSGAALNAQSANRKDTFRYSSLALTYAPSAALQVGLSVYRDQQDSSRPLNGYRANGAMINARYEF